jgi:integrase
MAEGVGFEPTVRWMIHHGQQTLINRHLTHHGIEWFVASSVVMGHQRAMASVRLKKGSANWFACITLPDGRRRQFSTGLSNQDDALAVAVNAERATKRSRSERQLRESFTRLITDVLGVEFVSAADWITQWGERQKSEVSEESAKVYQSLAKNAAAFFRRYKNLGLADINTDHVTKMRDEWALTVSTGTANGRLKVLRVALGAAWKSNLIPDNPAAKVKALAKKQTAESKATARRGFTPAEIELVLGVTTGEWRALVLLGLFSGQRMTDLATLKWANVDLNTCMLSFIAGKTGATVDLPLLPPVVDALAALPSSDDPHAAIFAHLSTLTKAGRSNGFRSILAGIGLAPPIHRYTGKKKGAKKGGTRQGNPLSFHSLRHTATTMLKSAGVADSIARAIIGHESAAVSRVYTHLDPATMRAALEKAYVNTAA